MHAAQGSAALRRMNVAARSVATGLRVWLKAQTAAYPNAVVAQGDRSYWAGFKSFLLVSR